MRIMALIALGAGGCSGGGEPEDPIEPPITTPPDNTGTTVDTAPEGANIDATFYAVSARFGFDPASNTHVAFAASGEGLTPIQLVVTLIDSSAQYTEVVDADNSCTVTLEAEGNLPVAGWVEPNGAWTGFDIPAGSTVRDNCAFYGLPAAFEGEAGRHVSKWRWGIGIGALTLETEAELRANLPPSEWDALQPYAVGSGLSSNVLEAGTGTGDGYDTGLGLGFAVDGNFEIIVDGVGNPEPLARDLIDQEVGIARGYYEATLGPFEAGALTGEPL